MLLPDDAAIALARAYVARFLAVQAHRRPRASALGPTEDEVSHTLTRDPQPDPPALDAEDARVVAAGDQLLEAIAADPFAALTRLTRLFELAPIDLAIVAVLLAPELDHELERAYTFALDDFTRKRPDLGFVARLIAPRDPVLARRIYARLEDTAPLRRHGVVTVAPAGDAPMLMRQLRLADRIVAYIHGLDTIDESVRACVRVGGPPPAREAVVMAPALVERIARALEGSRAPRVLLAGPSGNGRALIVHALCGAAGRGVVRIDLEGLVADGRIGERLPAALREAALRDATAILDGGTSIDKEPPRGLAQAIADGTSGLHVPVVFTFSGHPNWLVQAVPGLLELDVPALTLRERIALWRHALPPPLVGDEDLETMAARYAFTGGTIMQAARRAETSARLRDPEAPRVTLEELGDAARLMFAHRLGGLAQRIPTGFTWADLVLPAETYEGVREVVTFARHRAFLLEEWGFAAKLPYGRGVSAILAGPPGTGKTMVAQLLAHELGYDLFRIDLSQVVNKYIGETEKNLARIFDEAESSHAVLFFDEADSLFAKRTEVKSSNDRYANLEVNYLLQRMETYDGVTLLATNIEQGLDEAFKRRVRFSIAFEMPEEAERSKLWRSMFPPKVPLDEDIEWELLARSFEMAGGYIKKAALRAALLAVAAGRSVGMRDLLDAARAEYREMGRVV